MLVSEAKALREEQNCQLALSFDGTFSTVAQLYRNENHFPFSFWSSGRVTVKLVQYIKARHPKHVYAFRSEQ